jgi:hypothetical protein
MNLRHTRTYFMLCSLVFIPTLQSFAQHNSNTAKAVSQQSATVQDGQHDFDFEIGNWHTHLSRLQHPLTGSTTWVEYDGTSVISKVWSGRANLVELKVDGPAGRVEGASLRLYNPQAHQWSLNFAGIKGGEVGVPTVGEFKNGRGEFYDQEIFKDRTILVRQIFSDITPNKYKFEQSFSDDGGKTWEANWIAIDTRVTDLPDTSASASKTDELQAGSQQTAAEKDGQHGFDFNFGTWDTHVSRLQHPLTGSTAWVEYDGTSFIRKIWDGRASLFELEVTGPAGHIEGVGFRLYNPESHQWSLNWANSNDGILARPPNIGEFKDDHGDFYDSELFNGKLVFVRNGFSQITPDSSRFEQAFSADGGKTWETNWIMTFTRPKGSSDKTR